MLSELPDTAPVDVSVVSRGHAYFAERTIRAIKKAMLSRSASAARRLKPNQRKKARYHAGGAEPPLLRPRNGQDSSAQH